MSYDKTEEQENNNEMEQNLGDVQEQSPDLETELNKATSDENNKNPYAGMSEEEFYEFFRKSMEEGKIAIDEFEELMRRRNVGPEREEVNPDADISSFLSPMNPLSLIPAIAQKFIYLELMLSDNFNSMGAKVYDLTNLFINKVEPCLMHIGNVSEIVERIERDIAEIKDKLAGVSPPKKTRAKRKAKAKKTGSVRGRRASKVGAKRIGRPPKKTSANVSHTERGIKKRRRGRQPAKAGRKGRRT